MKKCTYCNGSGKKTTGMYPYDVKVPCTKCHGKGMK